MLKSNLSYSHGHILAHSMEIVLKSETLESSFLISVLLVHFSKNYHVMMDFQIYSCRNECKHDKINAEKIFIEIFSHSWIEQTKKI